MDRAILKIILYCTGIMVIISLWLLVCADGKEIHSLLSYVFIMIFGYIAMISDWITKRIPNSLILSMFAIWLVIAVTQMFIDTKTGIQLLTDSMLGFVTGGGLFLLVYLISRKGLGGGDVKFMAAAGLFLGFSLTVPVVLYGTVLAALTGMALILLKKIGRKDAIPLAPFLYAGILITVFIA